jgi:hypothetical protein
MGMRYAGFMAAARDDRLTREEREEAEGVRNEAYQRQIERDEAAHQRQIDLLDMRQQNALKLQGIAASKAQRVKDKALRKQVDAFIAVNGLEDTTQVRTEISNGIDLLGTDFIAGYNKGQIRLNSTTPTAVSTEVPEFSMGVSVDDDPGSAQVNSSTSAFAPEAPTELSAGDLKLPDTPVDNQMSELSLDDEPALTMPQPEAEPTTTAPEEVELSMGAEVEEEQAPAPENMISYGNREFLNISDYAGKDANDLEQAIRMLEGKGYTPEELAPLRTELDFVQKAEKDPDPDFSELLIDADSVGKLSALQNSIDASPEGTFTEAEITRRTGLINAGIDRLTAQAIAKAERDGGSLMFTPFTSNGSLGLDGQMVKVQGGKYFDLSGTEISADVIAKGRVLDPSTYETFVRNFNGQAGKIAESVTVGANALTSLSNYRKLVIDSPQGLNPFLSVGGKVLGVVNSANSAVQGLVSGEYTYETFENEILNNLRDLSQQDRLIAQAQLRAAYAMASFAGSSGQALSDKELKQNLESIGQGVSDPKKIVGLINASMKSVVEATEQKRSIGLDGFIATNELRETMSTTAIGTPFSDYIQKPGLFSADNMAQINEGIEGKVDYPYGSSPQKTRVGRKPISEMTYEEYIEDVKTWPTADGKGKLYDQFTEDALKNYFVQKGGKL